MDWIIYIVVALFGLFVGFIFGATREIKKMKPAGVLIISKENDIYLQSSEELIANLKNKDFAILGVIEENKVAENAPSITE